MPGLAETLLSLRSLRNRVDDATANLAEPLRLSLVAPRGSNPGDLRMLTYVPPGLPPGAPLVVVLHGCTQNAAAYDHGAGWSALAERHGFALLLPEQQRANNSHLCFNWFQPDDVTAGRGEAGSIRQMTEQMLETHRLDRRRVFVTGLSAGGAMTAAMLATAPDLFTAGAIIAGLPYGAASSVQEAFSAMNQSRHRTAREWGDRVRAAAPAGKPWNGPWPTVQIWQGLADHTVKPANADELALQWANVHGQPERPTASEIVDGASHDRWDVNGRPVVERWLVPGLAHGTPIVPNDADADHAVGIPGPHMLKSIISSTWHIAASWGLLTQAARPNTAGLNAAGPNTPRLGAARPTATRPSATPTPGAATEPHGTLVERTLKAAGLIR